MSYESYISNLEDQHERACREVRKEMNLPPDDGSADCSTLPCWKNCPFN